MPTDLASPAPRQGRVTEDVATVLVEWLLQWFDGATKPFAAGGEPVSWPALSTDRLGFGTAPLPHPLEGVFITVLLLDRGKPAVFPCAPPAGVARASLHESLFALQFIVRASVGPAHPRWGSDEAALADVAGLLHGLLGSIAAREQLELCRLLVEDEQRLPVPREGDVALSLVSCSLRARVMVV